MEWAEGWANENEGGLESSFTEGESSLAPSHEMNDSDDGLKARLSAVADSLVATLLRHRSLSSVCPLNASLQLPDSCSERVSASACQSADAKRVLDVGWSRRFQRRGA